MKRKLIEHNGVLISSRKHPLYVTWFHMLEKCRNPRYPSYENFGGKGIKVCPDWSNQNNGLENFIKSVGDKPHSNAYGLLRKDNNKDFNPDNCYWGIRNQSHKGVSCVLFEGQKIFKTKHPLYATYLEMINRCTNPDREGYVHYGARGIKVCDRWMDEESGFSNFISDMGPKPTDKHTIDREDVNGNYEPSNCRWATGRIQNINRRVKPTSGEYDIRIVSYDNNKSIFYFYCRVLKENGEFVRKIVSPHYRLLEEAMAFREKMNYRLDNNLPYEDLLTHTVKKLPQSNIKGVVYIEKHKNWRAEKKINKNKYYLGTYFIREDAERIVLEFEKRIRDGLSFDDLIKKRQSKTLKSKYPGVTHLSKRNAWIGRVKVLSNIFMTPQCTTEEQAYQLREQLLAKYNVKSFYKRHEIEFDPARGDFKVTAFRLIPYTPFFVGRYPNKEAAEKALRYMYSEEYKRLHYRTINNAQFIELLRPYNRTKVVFSKVNEAEYYEETASFIQGRETPMIPNQDYDLSFS